MICCACGKPFEIPKYMSPNHVRNRLCIGCAKDWKRFFHDKFGNHTVKNYMWDEVFRQFIKQAMVKVMFS